MQVDPQERNDGTTTSATCRVEPEAPGRRGEHEDQVPNRARGPRPEADHDAKGDQVATAGRRDAGRRTWRATGVRLASADIGSATRLVPEQPARPVGRAQDRVPGPAAGEERCAAGQPAEGVVRGTIPVYEELLSDGEVPPKSGTTCAPGRERGADKYDGRDRSAEEPVVAEQEVAMRCAGRRSRSIIGRDGRSRAGRCYPPSGDPTRPHMGTDVAPHPPSRLWPRSVHACSWSWPCYSGRRRPTNTRLACRQRLLAGLPLDDPTATSITPYAIEACRSSRRSWRRSWRSCRRQSSGGSGSS